MPKDLHRLCQHRLFVSSHREGDGCRSRCRTRPARRRGAARRCPTPPAPGGRRRWPPAAFPFSPALCPRSPARWQHFWAIRRRRPGEGGRWAGAGAGAAGRGSAGSPGAASGPLAAGRWAWGEEERVESGGNVGPRSRTRWSTLPGSTAWPLAARRGGRLPSGVFRTPKVPRDLPSRRRAQPHRCSPRPKRLLPVEGAEGRVQLSWNWPVPKQDLSISLEGGKWGGKARVQHVAGWWPAQNRCRTCKCKLDLRDTHGFSDLFSISGLIWGHFQSSSYEVRSLKYVCQWSLPH